MDEFFIEITVILVLAGIGAVALRLVKQPPVLAYIFAGLLLGPLGLFEISSTHSLESFSHIGITLLLFLLGLELKISDLQKVGKVAVITGIGQIVFTSAIGYVLAVLLGFGTTSALYLAIGLTFSSTIVIVKLLSDKKDVNSLYGRISIGFLLVQDFIAILALVVLSGMGAASAGSTMPVVDLIIVLSKAGLLFIAVFVISKLFFNKIVHFFSTFARGPISCSIGMGIWIISICKFGIYRIINGDWWILGRLSFGK